MKTLRALGLLAVALPIAAGWTVLAVLVNS